MSLAPERRAALHAALTEDLEWQAFLRHFELSRGFSFLLLLVDSRENAELCLENLEAHLKEIGLGSIRQIPADSPEEFLRLPSLLRNRDPELFESEPGAIWVEAVATEGDPAFEKWQRAWRGCFAHLNPMRNILQRVIPSALIFVGAPWVRVAIRESAPDLWSIRGGVTKVAPQVEAGLLAESQRGSEPPGTETEDAPDPEYALQMAKTLRGKPGQEAELVRVLQRAGEGFLALNEASNAIRALEEAISLETESFSGGGRARTRRLLGRAYRMVADWTRAETYLREALELDSAAFGDDSAMAAIDLDDLGSLLRETNRLPEAESLYRRSLALSEKQYGPDHLEVSASLNNLGILLLELGRFDEAEPLLRHALAIKESHVGPNSPDVAAGLGNLFLLLKEQGRLSEAEPLARRALEIYESAFGPEHPRVAVGLVNLGFLLRATNRLREAEPLFRRALAIDEMRYGTEHPEVAIDLNHLATLLYDRSQYAEAEQMYRRALMIDEKFFGPNHPRVATRLNNLARLLHQTERAAEAEPLSWRALQILKQFERETGYKRPQFDSAAKMYFAILSDLAWSDEQIAERLRSLDPPSVPAPSPSA